MFKFTQSRQASCFVCMSVYDLLSFLIYSLYHPVTEIMNVIAF